MKRKRRLVLCIGLVLVLAAGGFFAYPHLFKKPVEVIEMDVHADYANIYPEDLYERSDLVITGIYEGDEDTYADIWTGFPHTKGTVTVTQVLKGSCGDTVVIGYRGGEIPMLESLMVQESLSEEEVLKQNQEVKNQVLRLTNAADDRVKAVAGQEYIFFLLYDSSLDLYNTGSQAYSMRPLNDKDQALNPNAQNYETLHIMEEAKALTEEYFD